jgi:pimeloyl-ACP methyl ester carboxylesterase
MRRTGICVLATVLFTCVAPAGAMTPQQRKEYWQKFSAIIPQVASFDQWLEKTGALPPDFDSLPRINTLPDPLLFLDGKRVVKNAEDWKARRQEIIDLFEKYDIGRVPPKPALDKIVPVDPAQAPTRGGRGFGGPGAFGGGRGRGPASGPAGTTGPATGAARGRGFGAAPPPLPGRGGGNAARGPRAGGGFPGGGGRGAGAGPLEGSVTKIVDLYYGPESKIVTRVTLTIPPGNGPFPVLMGGQPNITSRGYISCSFNMSVDPPMAPNIAQYYPDYDFGTMGQVAFTARMVVDYLYTLPEVDKRYIAITGYSRGGKMAAITAMLEERITACIAGSTGVGGVLPWRSASERGSGESIESTTRSFPAWFTPTLRFFTCREDRLPIDGNLLEAAIAPRAILSFYGTSDEVGNIYGNEASYNSAQRIYKLLGAEDKHGLFQVSAPNPHHGANDPRKVDAWLDYQFGKSAEKFQSTFLFPWDYEKWKTDSKASVDLSKYPAKNNAEVLSGISSTADWEKKAADVRKNVQSILGTKEGGKGGPDPAQRGRDDVADWVVEQHGASGGWFGPQLYQTDFKSITFGQGTRAELYYPLGTKPDAKLPTVVWLHGFSYPMGYMFIYRSSPDLHPILALVRAGYAVLAYDQTGHGSRTDEFATFYDRFPNWSRMGRMVSDVSAGIDAIGKESMCDANRVYLYGYSMGGMVALHAAALDPRVKGVVSICGFTPMRTDTVATGTGGIARWSIDLPLIPKLGFFVGHESQLPYDYNELIASIAPRPVYIAAPQFDRDANSADVHAAVEQSRKIFNLYNASDKLMLDEPFDYNRLPESTQDRIIGWMKQNMK